MRVNYRKIILAISGEMVYNYNTNNYGVQYALTGLTPLNITDREENIWHFSIPMRSV